MKANKEDKDGFRDTAHNLRYFSLVAEKGETELLKNEIFCYTQKKH